MERQRAQERAIRERLYRERYHLQEDPVEDPNLHVFVRVCASRRRKRCVTSEGERKVERSLTNPDHVPHIPDAYSNMQITLFINMHMSISISPSMHYGILSMWPS